MLVKVNGKEYYVNDYEFNKVNHNEFTQLNILNSVGKLERLVFLINELSILKIEILQSPQAT